MIWRKKSKQEVERRDQGKGIGEKGETGCRNGNSQCWVMAEEKLMQGCKGCGKIMSKKKKNVEWKLELNIGKKTI